MIKKLLNFIFLVWLSVYATVLVAQVNTDYQLTAGDSIKITVFQNPDLTLETRISESGSITYPLIGSVQIGGLSTSDAEQLIAQRLKSGNFVKKPQVNISLTEVRGSQVAVLGMVNKPGRFPLELANNRLSDLIAMAGGVTTVAGSGNAIITGVREGKTFRTQVDIAALFLSDGVQQDIAIRSGDVIYVIPGNQVSVLGQVNHAGRYPLENLNMRLSEVLTMAGGVTPDGADTVVLSGTRNGQAIHKEVDIPGLFLKGKVDNDLLIAPGDEIYVHRAPMFYIYGEAQKPGSYRVERNMTVIQALAQGGGPTARGTQRNIKLLRRNADGAIQELSPKLTDPVQPDDVLYVRESLF
ncbi:MAG TPA: SLBB domain-containing protein [Methylophilaceae bacterium]